MIGVLSAALISYTTAGLLASVVAMIYAVTTDGKGLSVLKLHTMTAWGACLIFGYALLHTVLA